MAPGLRIRRPRAVIPATARLAAWATPRRSRRAPSDGGHAGPGGAATAPRRSWILFVLFSVIYAFFISAPALFHQEFPLRRDIEWGDVLDIATPLLVFATAWALMRASVGSLGGRLGFAFLLLALVWTQGQGMHLAANSIQHQVPENASGALPDLIHFYDEQLSHYIWYLGAGLLPLFFLVVLWRRRPVSDARAGPAVLLAAVLYGVTLGLSSIEAAVVPLTFSFFVLTLVFAAFLYRSAPPLRRAALFTFCLTAVAVAIGVLVGWGAYHGGWPELSDVGLI